MAGFDLAGDRRGKWRAEGRAIDTLRSKRDKLSGGSPGIALPTTKPALPEVKAPPVG